VTERGRRGRLKWTAARWVRVALIFVLAGVVVSLAAVLAVRIGRETPDETPRKTDSLQTNVNVMENVQFAQFKGDKGKIEARGDRNVRAGEGLFRMEGNVEIVDHGRKGGREIRIRGDSLTYDKDWTNFSLQGRVRVEFKDMRLEASDFTYDREKEVMSTSAGVSIVSPGFEASSRKMIFYTQDEEAVLEDTVRVAVRIKLSPEQPLILTGEKFHFGFKRRSGNVEGGLSLEHGKSRGNADTAFLEQFADTDDLRLVELAGNVRLHVEEPKAGASGKEGTPPAKAAPPKPPGAKETGSSFRTELRLGESLRQEIEASTVRLFAHRDAPALERIELGGAAVITFHFASGAGTGIAGEAVRLDFDRTGGLAAFGADSGAWIESRGPGRELLHSLEGESIRYFGDTSVMTVARSEKTRARLAGVSSEVQADKITIFVEKDDFEAEGGVQMRSQSAAPAAGVPEKGFFASGRPVFCQSQSLRFLSASRRFSLSDPARPVRAWQDDKVLTAKEIAIVEDGAEVTAAGAVRAFFSHKTADGTPRRIEIDSDRMRFEQASGQIVYDGSCRLGTGSAVLRGETIAVDPGVEAGTVKTMRAARSKAGPVTIAMGDRDASGDLAIYDVVQDTITVTGNPVLKEKATGEVRGDKLTFYLSDGRIQVQERSSAAIKS
jgi:lipopolysaccharide transport protein LptA